MNFENSHRAPLLGAQMCSAISDTLPRGHAEHLVEPKTVLTPADSV